MVQIPLLLVSFPVFVDVFVGVTVTEGTVGSFVRPVRGFPLHTLALCLGHTG